MMLFPTKMCSFQFFFLYDLIMFLFSPLNQQESLFMDFWHHWPGGHYINSFNQRKALLWSPRILIREDFFLYKKFCCRLEEWIPSNFSQVLWDTMAYQVFMSTLPWWKKYGEKDKGFSTICFLKTWLLKEYRHVLKRHIIQR